MVNSLDHRKLLSTITFAFSEPAPVYVSFGGFSTTSSKICPYNFRNNFFVQFAVPVL